MRLTLDINGSSTEIDASVQATLAEAIQSVEGDRFLPTPCKSATCGACTVLLNDAPVLSCIMPASLCERIKLTTASGLTHDARLASLRNLFADLLILPCGICASGFLASTAALLDANPRPTLEDVRYALAGNVCLCIGYGAILDAVMAEAAVEPAAPTPVGEPDHLPSQDHIAHALAQERGIAFDETVDPLSSLRSGLQHPTCVVALDQAATAFGWSSQLSTAKESQRQLSGSWVALQGTDKNGAVVFVELQVDSETEIISLRRVVTLLLGVSGIPAAVAESGVMRGIFLALRPDADKADYLFPAGFPTSIDLPETSNFTTSVANHTADAPREIRRDVSLATMRAIAGAIHSATGTFPERAPFAPQWSIPV